MTFKKRKLHREEAAENEQKKEKEWEAMGRRSRSRELRAEARDRVRSQSREQSVTIHDSANDANSIHSIQEDRLAAKGWPEDRPDRAIGPRDDLEGR
jgi:hypothetical protein